MTDAPLCPSCGQPGSAELGGGEHGWQCRNEACLEFGQPLQEREPERPDPPDPGRQGP